MVATAPLQSARLTALAEELAARRSGALPRFWQKVSEAGTPLVESVPDDASHRLVTFLWRGGDDVQSVVLAGGPAGHRQFAGHYLAQLPNTDVWYTTYRIRSDARFCYLLGPNAKAAPESLADMPPRLAAFGLDPLNHHPFPSDQPAYSSVELPAAPPEPWLAVRDGLSRGTVEQHSFRSEMLSNERPIWVYTPPGHRQDGDCYALLLLFDGQGYLSSMQTPHILDNLLADGRIPPLVAVLVEHPNRVQELTCSVPFVEFLVSELVPWVRERYHVTADPIQTIVGGGSFGGLAACFAGLQHSEVFGKVLAQASASWWSPNWSAPQAVGDEPQRSWIVRQFVARERLPLQFHLDAGLMELGGVGPIQMPVNELEAGRHLRDVLEAKGYAVHYQEFNGGHDYLSRRAAFVDGLLALAGVGGAPEGHA